MNKDSKIFVFGGTGLVGSALIRKLKKENYSNIYSVSNGKKKQRDNEIKHLEIDLRIEQDVARFFSLHKPEYVFLASAKVGGIVANATYRAQFIFENLQIQNNIIHHSYLNKVKKLLFLGSSCIYPRECKQPMKEEYLLSNVLEYTNEPYAMAKIAGIKLCESYNIQYGTNFISVMPTNLYGPNDNFHLENSHVLPALIRKCFLAKALENKQMDIIRNDFEKRPIEGINPKLTDADLIKSLERFGIFVSDKIVLKLWGTGKPRREFLHSDDLADACLYLMENVDFKDMLLKEYNIEKLELPPQKNVRNTHINIGTGKDLTIAELAHLIKEIVGFNGEIQWNTEKPDGTFQKLLDVSKLNAYGWQPKIKFKDGIRDVFKNYILQ